MNLKELKDELNKIENDELLKNFRITHKMAGFEDPEAEVGLVFFTAEEEFDKHYKLLELEPMQKIKEFANRIWNDSRKAVAGMMDEDVFENYSEQDCP